MLIGLIPRAATSFPDAEIGSLAKDLVNPEIVTIACPDVTPYSTPG